MKLGEYLILVLILQSREEYRTYEKRIRTPTVFDKARWMTIESRGSIHEQETFTPSYPHNVLLLFQIYSIYLTICR